MPATPFSRSFLISQPRFNYYINPIFRSLSHQPSSSPFPFNVKSSTVRWHCALSQAAETDSTSGGRSGALSPTPPVTGQVQKIDVNPPKGTRDFPPEEMRLRNWLFNHFKEVYFMVIIDYCISLCSTDTSYRRSFHTTHIYVITFNSIMSFLNNYCSVNVMANVCLCWCFIGI